MHAATRCPGCGAQPLHLHGETVQPRGVSYDLVLVHCEACGYPISTVWHPAMLATFAERVVKAMTEPALRDEPLL